MNNITGTNLFIGDQFSSVSKKMKENDIRHVLNVTPVYLPLDQDLNLTYKQIPWEDNTEQNILEDLEEGLSFLDSVSGEPVLICCQAGRSRSGSMLIAYMMKTYKMSFKEVLENVRKDRPKIDPNSGFVEQLKKIDIYQN